MLVLAVMICGCSTLRQPAHYSPAVPGPARAGSSSQIVTASWYGRELSGRRTSDGEVFNPDGLTAASRTLPIGSRVAVTNVSNGRTVVVRINDRGPYVKGRSIDLSHAAAQRIGLTSKGTGRVEISSAGGERPSGEISPVAYTPGPARSCLPQWRSSTYHYSRRRNHTRHYRRLIVRNPIGDWIVSALPHF